MTRAEYQAHFMESFGPDWEFTPSQKKARIWNYDMAHRVKNGLPVFPNPWKDAPTGS